MMQVKLYSPKEFYERYKEELLSKESAYQLLVFNCMNAIENINSDCLIGTVEDESSTYLFFQYMKPYRMLVHALGEVNEQMVKTLLDFIKQEKIDITGFNASSQIVNLAIKVGSLTEYNIRSRMDIMELKKDGLIEQEIVGQLVLGTKQDIQLALEWYVLFYQDCFNELVDSEEYRAKMNEHVSQQHLFFYEVNGEKVAMALITRQLSKGVSIGMVYTLASKRGHSYCKQMMSELAKWVFNLGNQFACLYVDKKNPISNKAYETIGYQILKMEDKIDIGFTI